MTCRVPGCSTRYWDKNNKHTLFRAPSAKQLADWRDILSHKGIDDFGANDQVCILHFKEEHIERERIIYQFVGLVSRQPRKLFLLTYNAVPTIFPSKIPRAERKKRQKPQTHLNYAVTIDAETLAKHREVLKRKLPSDDDVSCDDVKSAKLMKTNNLFQSIVNAIHNHEKVSSHLNSLWIANICDDKCIRWSLWKVDRSGEEKGINLHEDLEVEVFVNDKKIQLPNMDSVVQMCDLQNLFKKISQILPCKVADYESKES